MEQFFIHARAPALALGVAVFASICMPPAAFARAKAQPPAAAPAKPADEAAQKQQAAAAARAAYDAGVKEYQGGKYDAAIQSFTTALRASLSSTDIAHTLYYRGLSYKKQGKQGLAISDLTSAIWLKNGLSDSERQSATSERAEAYKLAGLPENTGSSPEPSAAGSASPQTATEAAGAAPARAQNVAQDEVASLQSGVAGSVAGGERPAAANLGAKTATPAAEGESSEQTTRLLAALNGTAPTYPTPPAQTNQAAAAAPATSSTGSSFAIPTSVSGFFSNMFGGGTSSATTPTPASVTTASTTAPVTATSSWSNTTSITSATTKSKATSAAAGFETRVAASPPKAGIYKVHIAALRSRAEAEALAQKLAQQQSVALANHTPTVDEAVIGSMGTFYRVRVGSFATADEPRGLCNTLRTSGYDCLVVTN